MREPYLTSRDAARIADAVPDTIRLWVRVGRLQPVMRTPSGVQLFRRRDVERVVAARRCQRDWGRRKKTDGNALTVGSGLSRRLTHNAREETRRDWTILTRPQTAVSSAALGSPSMSPLSTPASVAARSTTHVVRDSCGMRASAAAATSVCAPNGSTPGSRPPRRWKFGDCDADTAAPH